MVSTPEDIVKEYARDFKLAFGDLEAMRAVLVRWLTPDAVLVEPSNLPWGGTWTGVTGWMESLSIVVEQLKTHADPILRESTLGAEDVVQEQSYLVDGQMVIRKNVTPVKSIELTEVRDGRIARVEVYLFDSLAMAGALGG